MAPRRILCGIVACLAACQFAPDSVALDGVDSARARDAPSARDGPSAGDGSSDDALASTDAATDGAPTDAPIDAPGCPDGYTSAGPGRCTRLVATGRDWLAAETDCEADGAHLVVIDDVGEDGEVPDNVWIGLSERATAGSFLWVTPTALGFTGWASGQPATGGGLCVEARADGWHDDGCAEAKAYLCERDGLAADPSRY